MTGFGDARASAPGLSVNVEVRSVNNRHLKVTVRGSDPYPLLESELEKVVRRTVKRGTILIHVRVERDPKPGELRLNPTALKSYLEQLRAACEAADAMNLLPHLAGQVLALPGVTPEAGSTVGVPEDEWPTLEKVLVAALEKLDRSRREEGRAMATELLANHKFLMNETAAVRSLIPGVMSGYRTRLLERVRSAIGDAGVMVETDHLIREIALFADRIDVSEELTRFAAHLDQFAELVRTGADGAGRRLEFVVQEMGREANTLGSKAGDVSISRRVVEIKAALEKVRELVQNVE